MENAEASANPSSSSPRTKAGAQREGENKQDLTKDEHQCSKDD